MIFTPHSLALRSIMRFEVIVPVALSETCYMDSSESKILSLVIFCEYNDCNNPSWCDSIQDIDRFLRKIYPEGN